MPGGAARNARGCGYGVESSRPSDLDRGLEQGHALGD